MSQTHNALLRQGTFIDGKWVAADNGETIAVTNPATGEQIGTVPALGTAETRRAIEAAHKAFKSFSQTTSEERAGMLRRLSDLIIENQQELAELLTLEQGKPLAEAKGEILMSAKYILWFAEEARRIYGDIVPSPWKGRQLLVTREPVGVVAAITPWNFPSSMLARKIGPALAAGCTIVAKPATQTPYSGLIWAELCAKAGIPDGVVNIITGPSGVVGAELLSNPKVRKVTFTGSTEVGKQLLQQGAGTVKRVSMELGGNAPFIVFDDADIDRAVEGVLASKYRNSGQTCVCTNRVYVQAGIHERFVERLVAATAALNVGSGFDADVQQGPLIDGRAVESMEAILENAVSHGGKIVLGGKPHQLGGNFFEPTIVTGANSAMALAREEIFGPIAPVFRFDSEDEVIARANDTEFGLACYFYTSDLARAFRVSRALEYGIVGVNEGLVTTEVAPFGGYKESGMGREGGKHGIDDYLETKYISLGLGGSA
jgi:succinate-semialdehyde dehydrogenase/glutarate-semialdehyde dehydrogenase